MRERTTVLIVGAEGTGKSSLANALIGAACSRREPVAGIVAGGLWGGGPMPLDAEEWVEEKVNARPRDVDPNAPGFHGLLVLDDCERYVPKSPKKQSVWRDLAFRKRHLRIDLLLTAHRVADLPSEILTSTKYLYVFACSRSDLANTSRLHDIAPELVIPSEPYRFVRYKPLTIDGEQVAGRTKPGGGFELDP